MNYIKLGTLVLFLFLNVLTGNGMLFAADEVPKKSDAPSSGPSAPDEGVQERAVPLRPGMVAPPPLTVKPMRYSCEKGKCKCDNLKDCLVMGNDKVCVPGTFSDKTNTCTEKKP